MALEVMVGDLMVIIEIMIEGEMESLALGFLMVWGCGWVRVPRCRLFDSAVLGSLKVYYNSSARNNKFVGPFIHHKVCIFQGIHHLFEGQGSPRKEKRIWSWRGERRFWAGR